MQSVLKILTRDIDNFCLAASRNPVAIPTQ